MTRKSIAHHVADVLYGIARTLMPGVYAQDGLITVHTHEFMSDPAFQRAYARGLRVLQGVDDYEFHWRVHVGLWAASTAAKVDGDFVECGVNKGFMSSAIMEYLDWNALGRTFYLLDSFAGMDERAASERERKRNRRHLQTGFYTTDVEQVAANFAQWRDVRIVQGLIPDTLPRVSAPRIAYLHLDMNAAVPEIAAAEFFWDRLSPGAVMLLDDYAYLGYLEQKHAFDAFAAKRDVPICSLPTGQGVIVKPPWP